MNSSIQYGFHFCDTKAGWRMETESVKTDECDPSPGTDTSCFMLSLKKLALLWVCVASGGVPRLLACWVVHETVPSSQGLTELKECVCVRVCQGCPLWDCLVYGDCY